jgi:hypothetical protein
MSNINDNFQGGSPTHKGGKFWNSRSAIWTLTITLFAAFVLIAGCVQDSTAASQSSTTGSSGPSTQHTTDIHAQGTAPAQQDPQGAANMTPPGEPGDAGQQVQPSGTPPEGGEMGPGGGMTPDLAAAAEKLGVTDQALSDALGDTSQGPGDFAAAAQTLGVTEQELMDALGGGSGGAPPGDQPGGNPPSGTPPQ